MTLKEKFIKLLYNPNPKLNSDYVQANQCKEIAEDYAIEFAEWLMSNPDLEFEYEDDNHTDGLKQLLEIFKKEKGL
jgi:hypothetical protein